MNNFSNIDANRPATFKQFEFAVYKLAEGMGSKMRPAVKPKVNGKTNPKFKILKARIQGATAKFYGDKNPRMTHGEAQKFISSGIIPNEIKSMVNASDLKSKS